MGQITPEQWSQLLGASRVGSRLSRVGMLDPTLERAGLPSTGRNDAMQARQSFAAHDRGEMPLGPRSRGQMPTVQEMFNFYLDFLKNRLGAQFPGNPFSGLVSPSPTDQSQPGPYMPSDFWGDPRDRGL